MVDVNYKAKLYYNAGYPRGLVKKTTPGHPDIYGLANYSNEVLFRFQTVEILTRNGYESLTRDMVDVDSSSHLMQLRDSVDYDKDARIRIRGIDLVNKLNITHFGNVTVDGYLPVWMSILVYNRWEYELHDFRLQVTWDNQKKERRVWVHNFSGKDLESEIQTYRENQTDLKDTDLYQERVSEFVLTDDEELALSKFKRIKKKMGLGDVSESKFVDTLVSWGIDRERASLIYHKKYSP